MKSSLAILLILACVLAVLKLAFVVMGTVWAFPFAIILVVIALSLMRSPS